MTPALYSDLTEKIMFPATRQQEGVWFHSIKNTTAYWNFVSVKSFSGKVHINHLKQSLELLVERHAALRTNILLRDNNLYQVIREELSADEFLIVSNYDKVTMGESIQIVNDAISSLQMSEYDFTKDVLLRLQVIRFPSTVFFVLSLNHIVTDAGSMQLFWSELAQCYNSLVTGKVIGLQSAGQYAEFALAQQDYFRTKEFDAQKKYWQSKLEEGLPDTDLPFCRKSSAGEVFIRETELSAQLTADAKSFALRKRVTHSSVFQLAYAILLYKYSGQQKVVIGNIVNGRGYGKRNYTSTIGFFADRILNIFKLNTTDTLEELLQHVNQTMLEGFANGQVPFEDIVRKYNADNRTGMSSLFRAAFNVIKTQPDDGWEGLTPYHNPIMSKNSGMYVNNQYDVYLFAIDNSRKVRLRLELLCDREHSTLIDLVLDSYIDILKKIIYTPQARLSKKELQTETEKGLYREFNQTAAQLPALPVIHELFRLVAAKHANKTAVVTVDGSLTYGELDALSDKWAAVIAEKVVRRTQPVGLLLNRTSSLLPAMLAILKAGSAYLPLDPDFPAARLDYMLADAEVELVVTEQSLKNKLPAGITALFPGEMSKADIAPLLTNNSRANDLAYVIYTSGSTGQPKGVMIEHKAVVNFVTGINRLIDCNNRKLYSLTTIGFDIFILESIQALCTGATIVLADKEAQDNPIKAAAEIIQQKADIVQFTPTRLRLMLQAVGAGFLSNLSIVLVGGEMLDLETLKELQKHCPGAIYNMYGPTETTVWSCVKDLTENEYITIGKPIANTDIYILDKQNGQEGIGIYGEMAIGGEGLARGYWNKVALTGEKFIVTEANGKRLYKTGDIGRWLPNGELEIAGRRDEQVKIRGYRVEPGEIEFHIKKHQNIKDVVVLHIRNEKCDDLFACYTSDTVVHHDLLRNELKRSLPAYMIPGYFIRFDSIPLTPNNKTNKVELMRLANEWINALQDEAVVDEGRGDDRLETLWWQTLQVDAQANRKEVSNFFEAGGHSLKALTLLEQIEKKFNIVVPVREFFHNPTLEYLQTVVSIEAINAHVQPTHQVAT